MRPTTLHQRWDFRWTPTEQAEAIARADEQALRARGDLNRLLDEIGEAAHALTLAIRWSANIREIQAHSASPEVAGRPS